MLSSEYCWAFHSECTEELLAMMPGMKRNEPSWPELRAHGAGWWVRSNDIMKRTIEKVWLKYFLKSIKAFKTRLETNLEHKELLCNQDRFAEVPPKRLCEFVYIIITIITIIITITIIDCSNYLIL